MERNISWHTTAVAVWRVVVLIALLVGAIVGEVRIERVAECLGDALDRPASSSRLSGLPVPEFPSAPYNSGKNLPASCAAVINR